MTSKTTMILAAHPDDETLGCGGTIARKVKQGFKVIIVVLTRGEKLFQVMLDIQESPSPDEVANIRRAETTRAVGILGVPEENLVFLDFGDATLDQHKDAAVKKVIALLEEYTPAELYYLNENEHHPDHRASNQIAREACVRVAAGIQEIQYIVGLKHGLDHSAIKVEFEKVDISEFIPLKGRAIEQFVSHYGILSNKQNKPLVDSPDKYLDGVELFKSR